VILLICVLAGLGVRAYRALVISALFGFIAALVWGLVVVPAVVGFALSMASAVAWCIWLDGHPDVNGGVIRGPVAEIVQCGRSSRNKLER
jgi:hypothetical protein